ncbi:glycosyltransferase [Roseibium litorale]|uniref:Glycosyltransferase family 4 protein n=1 Tax=Roseibium litorale TaxID=2803841 RepID=A0ABR9CW31_9HYPH|nr:glycosyltransferase [Roseibium litorale]MBD8894266.1 glycosyltransferase family 4 protein [Roseibium litorale]
MPYAQLLKFLGLKRKKQPLERRAEHLRKFVSYAPSPGVPPVADFDPERMRITWIIPDFMPGAGGHMTIFRIARYLEEFGHDVTFLIQNPTEHKTGDEAKASINVHFQPFKGRVELFSGVTPKAEGDALIATDRFTCYPVEAMGGFIRKFYFVQDYEPAFYPTGSESLLSEATYHFDFDCLCAGEWLHKIMSGKYGRWSTSWPLAYDASVYNLGQGATEPEPRSGNRIALYARYVTSRRAVELAFLALEILHQRGVQFEVDFFGWPLGKLSTGYPYRDHGILGGGELAALYRKATIGVVFSATNHSLVNKEMMACGLPVVDLDLDTVRSIFNENAMAFAKPTPDGIAGTLEALLADDARRKSLQQGGLAFLEGLSWENSARLVEKALQERVSKAAQGDLRP